MFTKTIGAALLGIEAKPITIEVNIVAGIRFVMTGLPDSAVKESQHRVESAIKSMGMQFPRHKTVVNLAPADIRKEGASYDLPIALGILISSNQVLTSSFKDYMIMGELALDGSLRPINGALSFALKARKMGLKGFILPKINANEAAVVAGIDVIGISTLREAVEFLNGQIEIPPVIKDVSTLFSKPRTEIYDFSDVQGQENIKRAMEIAAAGGHNVIMIGPPGAGKTMLSKRLPSILPPFTLEESLETTKIYSVSGKLNKNASLIQSRPFRSPHHTISDAAMVGGGGNPKPGEISLAHHGVLFLDELPEFKRTVLEVMRQPIEERRVTISRARQTIDYPANFMLIASMNPCPCGFYNHPEKECSCSPISVQKYLGKISGPLLDRIDLHIEVTPVKFDQMVSERKSETSESIRQRVIKARNIQQNRFLTYPGLHSNSMLHSSLLKSICKIDSESQALLKTAMEKLGLSARAYDRILKVSRTIADLEGTALIKPVHVAEAIQYRSLDRDTWGTS